MLKKQKELIKNEIKRIKESIVCKMYYVIIKFVPINVQITLKRTSNSNLAAI